MKDVLIALDFDGLLINSYKLLKRTFLEYNLDLGEEERFKNRRKFLKYLGGGKEWIPNLVKFTLPKKRHLIENLTEKYREEGVVYKEFIPFLNSCIQNQSTHVGVISRNFTMEPGITIRKVLRNSEIDEKNLDFVIPLPIGASKTDVLKAMNTTRYKIKIYTGDEISDYKAGKASDYSMYIASYGFDNKERLQHKGGVDDLQIFETPYRLVNALVAAQNNQC